jgi:hypothetical protein
MDEDLLERLRQLMQVPADATRTPAPVRQPTIGPAPSAASQARTPAPRRGLFARVLQSAEPSPNTPAGWANEMLNPVRAGAQARELVGDVVQSARRGNLGQAAGTAAMAMAPFVRLPRIRLNWAAKSAMPDDWHLAGTLEHPMNPRRRIVQSGDALGQYEVAPSPSRGGYIIQSIVGESGGGRAALNHLLRSADERGITLYLQPEPFGSARMTKKQLTDWYARNGFSAPDERGMMRRAPKAP